MGCLEAYAGGWAIARKAKRVIEQFPQEGVQIQNFSEGSIDISAITAKAVIEAYRKGDPLAKKIIDEVKNALIAGTASIVNILNPELLILGGGIVEGLPELIPLLQENIPKKALKTASEKLKITSSSLKEDAGVIGAATKIIHSLN